MNIDTAIEPSPGTAPPWRRRLAIRAGGISGSPIDDSIGLLERHPHPVIPLAIGAPAHDALPAAALRSIARELFDNEAEAAVSYGATEGEAVLRRVLLAWLRESGAALSDDELLITAGGNQGLDLACKLFVDPGDLVAVEDPTYPNGTAIITGYEGILLRCPMDADGLRIDRLRELGGRRARPPKLIPKLIYVIPNFQNPSGVSLSEPRRRELLALAETWDAIIVEDDPYGPLFFGGPPPPSLWQMGRDTGRVIAVGTFSKIVAPGLRVGWVQAPAPVIRKMVAAKQGMDTCANVVGQRVIGGFLERELLEPHLGELRRIYRDRRDAMLAALERWFGSLDGVRWSVPEGGFFLWLTLPSGLSADRLFSLALEEGVAFIPGSAFTGPGEGGNALRLCFAHPKPDAIADGIRRLRRAVERLSA